MKKEVSRLTEDLAKLRQDKVTSNEKLISEFRIDKVKEMDKLRERLKEKHSNEVAEMTNARKQT